MPAIELLRRRERPLGLREVGAIVITPTRELARQIDTVCAQLLRAVAAADSGTRPALEPYRSPYDADRWLLQKEVPLLIPQAGADI